MTTSTAQSRTPGHPEVPATMRAAVLKRQGSMQPAGLAAFAITMSTAGSATTSWTTR